MTRSGVNAVIAVGMVVALAVMMRPVSVKAADVDLPGILKVWRARQDRTRSIEFEWTERTITPKGHFSKLQQRAVPPALRKNEPEGVNPPEDLVYDRPVKLLLDGERLRYSYENKMWLPKEKRYVIDSHTSTFDGETSLNYHGPDGLSSFPTAAIYAEKWNSDAGIYHQRALLMAFRPFDFRMSRIDTRNLRLLEEQPFVEGRKCIVLEQTPARSESRQLFYVDPERDFTILRFTDENRSRLECKIDINYALDKKAGWIPDRWSLVWELAKEAGPESLTAKVDSYAINPVLDVERFRVQFPAGTWVDDARVTPSSMYLVKEDGKTRPIPRGEASATYEQLWNSEAGEAFLPPSKRYVSWWWVGGVGCILAAGLVLIWWKRLKSSAIGSRTGGSTPDAN